MLGVWDCVTTPMHCDISCAVNILVRTDTPGNYTEGDFQLALRSHLEHERVHPAEIERALANWARVGALWTLWPAEDSALIVDFFARWLPANRARVQRDWVDAGRLSRAVFEVGSSSNCEHHLAAGGEQGPDASGARPAHLRQRPAARTHAHRVPAAAAAGVRADAR